MKNLKAYNRPIMVHQVTGAVLEKFEMLHPKNTIVFDDGLYSQYLFRDKYLKFQEVWFAISPYIIRPDNISPVENIRCETAHEYAFLNKDYSAYMTIDEIKELLSMGYKIAVHGFKHINIESIDGFTEKLSIFKEEYIKGWQRFQELEIDLAYKAYCYPYNYKPICGDGLLKSAGYTRMFGSERFDIDTLLE